MKKLIVTLAVAVVMAVGLAGTVTPAHADPYTGSVPVKAGVKKVKKGKPGVVKIPMSASGNGTAYGMAKVICTNKAGKKYKRAARTKNGKARTKKLPSGKYTCVVKFIGVGVYGDSRSTVKVKVK